MNRNTKIYSDLVIKNMLRHISDFQNVSASLGQEKMLFGTCPKGKPWLTLDLFQAGSAAKATCPVFISTNVKSLLTILCNNSLQHSDVKKTINAFMSDVVTNHPNHHTLYEFSPLVDDLVLRFINIISWHIAAQVYELSHLTVNLNALMALINQLSMFSRHARGVINYLRFSIVTTPNVQICDAATAAPAVIGAATAAPVVIGAAATRTEKATFIIEEPDYDELLRQFSA